MLKKKSLYDKSEANRNKLIHKCVKRLYKEAIKNINFSIENGRNTTSINTFSKYMSLVNERSSEQEEIYNKVSTLLNEKYKGEIQTCIVPTGFMCSYRDLEIRICK